MRFAVDQSDGRFICQLRIHGLPKLANTRVLPKWQDCWISSWISVSVRWCVTSGNLVLNVRCPAVSDCWIVLTFRTDSRRDVSRDSRYLLLLKRASFVFLFGERNGNRKTNRSIMILNCLARNGEINLPRNEISQRGITIRDSQDNEPYQSFVSLFSFGWSHGEFVSFDRWNRIASKTIRLFKRHSTTNHRKEEKEGTRPMTERWLAGMKKEKEKKK